MTEPVKVNIAGVFKFFSAGNHDYKLGQFRNDWKELPTEDKQQIQVGIGNRTLTY